MSFKHHKQMSESFLTAAFLSVSGGLQDAYTYIFRGKVFANAQTGNIVLLSQSIIDKDFVRAIHYLVPLLFFALGIAIAECIHIKFQRIQHIHWRQLVLVLEILLLLVVGFLPTRLNLLANAMVSFSCAMQVQSFRKVNGYAFASTMCIGNIRSGTDALCAFIRTRDKNTLRKSLCYWGIILLFAIGAGIAIVMNNFLLVPVLAAGMMFLPFWYIKLTAGHYKKDIAAELETALSIITTAYLRSEDLQTAVEENINYLNPPVQGVFRSFLTRIKHIDPDMNAALAELKSAIDNEVWREWCEALSACQYDHSMKSTLNPIVAKLSDMRIINGELENLVFAPRKEFISMAALVVLNIPLLYFLNKDWYTTLMTTVPGKAVLAVCAAAIFLSFARVVKLTQPIEYRR